MSNFFILIYVLSDITNNKQDSEKLNGGNYYNIRVKHNSA